MVCYYFKKKHSTLKDKVWWGDEFNAERFFCHITPRIYAEF